ncbi:MAG: imelysin family protein [Gammaproteobacteria bacterium]|nr:imelysin family protein [Gammaproteobacteria bacterium]
MLKAIIHLTSTIRICLLLALCLAGTSMAAESTPATEVKLKPALLQYLYDQVLVADSQAAFESLQKLQEQLASQNANQPDWPLLQASYRDLALHWKAVEAMYIAGDLSDDYLDHPRYIDYYHQGNESISEQVNKALASNMALPKALFKHSNKGINALEVMLFPSQPITADLAARHIQAAQLSSQTIAMWLGEIAAFYSTDQSFMAGGKSSLSLLVNRLIDSSYKLAYWRVGEAAGLTPKTKDALHPQSLEFQHAKLSRDAIERILQTHQKIIRNTAGQDLMSVGKAVGVAPDIAFLQTRLDTTMAALQAVPEPFAEELTSAAYKTLFNELAMLQNAYYFMLINSLNLEARILDADGD